ncbi:hypothetical protein HYPGJ_31655 [Hyphomicrobium sp. GJ21]|nr:hypothetical protein HYPGJ_31655 [Hyphomicrobium sp. GJ21]
MRISRRDQIAIRASLVKPDKKFSSPSNCNSAKRCNGMVIGKEACERPCPVSKSACDRSVALGLDS